MKIKMESTLKTQRTKKNFFVDWDFSSKVQAIFGQHTQSPYLLKRKKSENCARTKLGILWKKGKKKESIF